jgi:hypothetical protein
LEGHANEVDRPAVCLHEEGDSGCPAGIDEPLCQTLLWHLEELRALNGRLTYDNLELDALAKEAMAAETKLRKTFTALQARHDQLRAEYNDLQTKHGELAARHCEMEEKMAWVGYRIADRLRSVPLLRLIAHKLRTVRRLLRRSG